MHVVAVCVTRPESEFLPQAIQAFREQTHPDKTLLLVTEPENVPGLRKYKADDVRLVSGPGSTLGDLRNVGIEFVAENYPDGFVQQFDGDDFHGARLMELHATIAGPRATVLTRQLCYSFDTDVAFVRTLKLYGAQHPPEGTPTGIHGTICHPVNAIRYPSLARGEDTPFYLDWQRGPGVVDLDNSAELYVRFSHGASTSGHEHVMQNMADAEPGTWNLSPSQAEYLRGVLSRYPVRTIRPSVRPCVCTQV